MPGRREYGLASLRALVAEVRRLLLPLLARLGVAPGWPGVIQPSLQA
jgi:hypothetical protein